MPAQITQYATIVPLDYEQGREEFAVVFVCHDWSELTCLLEDPECYLKKKGEKFGQKPVDNPGGAIPWEVQSPVTILFEWAGSNPDALRHTLASATQLQSAPNAVSENIGALDVSSFIDQAPKVRAELDTIFAVGVFIVDFAVRTRTITVRYHPPVSSSSAPIDSDALTDSTLVPQGPQEAGYAASLHFDIGDTAAQRAGFVVKYLEDQAGTLTKVLNAPQRDFKIGRTDFAEIGNDIVFSRPAVSQQRLAIEPAKLPPLVLVDMNPSQRVFGATVNGPGCTICVVVGGVLVNPWLLNPTGTTTFKCYAKPGG